MIRNYTAISAKLFFLSLILGIISPLFASGPRLAVLTPENRTSDPRYDYVGAIINGIVLYDLSTAGSVEIVDRSALDDALRERELSLSALAINPSKLSEGIVGADYILTGEYVLLGGDLRLTLKLVDTATTRVITFADAGNTENTVHGLVEGIVERITGRRPTLQEDGKSRSILKLRDETPGTIALFSPLIDAKILLDGNFIGYTTGDRRLPFVIDNVEPGPHELSTDLGRDFGVVKTPEIVFAPWKETVLVPAGKRVTVTDKSSHFNEQIYHLQYPFSKTQTFVLDASGRAKAEYSFDFQDRGGNKKKGRIQVDIHSGSIIANFQLDDERKQVDLSFFKYQEGRAEIDLGLIVYTITAESLSGKVRITVDARRTDIEQGMHRQNE
uniref:Curli production assembly/transport component CsgG n=1 Tax=Gracilinema caldarium TaxID=215591 RepID=A0A7C3I3R3_9SPIR